MNDRQLLELAAEAHGGLRERKRAVKGAPR